MRLRPAGPRALLAEVASLEEARALYREMARRRQDGSLGPVVDVVPAARSVLFDGVEDVAALARVLTGWQPDPRRDAGAPGSGRREIEIGVVYDGPDLGEVAELWGTDAAGAARRHAAQHYEVAFIGFAPGFAYLTGLPPELQVPRLARPRPAVPAGSVALGGEYTAVYPQSSPGGWRLIGRTATVMWDPERHPPALLAPGYSVRFVALDR